MDDRFFRYVYYKRFFCDTFFNLKNVWELSCMSDLKNKAALTLFNAQSTYAFHLIIIQMISICHHPAISIISLGHHPFINWSTPRINCHHPAIIRPSLGHQPVITRPSHVHLQVHHPAITRHQPPITRPLSGNTILIPPSSFHRR